MTAIAERLAVALADRYRIERELGAGGMATVYLAYDLRHQRRVALKVMRPELAAIVGADRFLAEITTTANLQHPHILALFDSGTVDGSVFYPIEDAVRMAMEVADALHYAHGHGVIHRGARSPPDSRGASAPPGRAQAISVGARPSCFLSTDRLRPARPDLVLHGGAR